MEREQVVSMCNYRDGLMIVTNRGTLFLASQAGWEQNNIRVEKLVKLPLELEEAP